MSIDIVVSCYRDDLGWLKGLAHPADRLFLYDKWEGKRTFPALPFEEVAVQKLPNVGMLDHSFLHHIVENYDGLADWTVFTPDGPHDHLPAGVRMDDALAPGNSLKVPWVFRAREWGPDGRLPWHLWGNRPKRGGTTWKDHYESGKIAPCELSFAEWARKYVGFDPDGPDWPGYAPGAIFGVPRRAITYLPKAFYARLRGQLSHARESEAGHYVERLWTVILSGKARYVNHD